MIRLAIAASSAVVRAGLETLARSDPEIELVGSFSDLSALDGSRQSDLEALRPDVILAAVPLEDLAPIAEGFAPPTVLLATESRPEWTRDVLRAGVRAVLPREASAGEILSAVTAAANGLAVLDPHDLDALLAAPASMASDVPVLTPRELEVLRMLAEGEPNKTIAWKLGISEHTAKFHVASILTKLDAGSRAEAVAIGMRKGMILL